MIKVFLVAGISVQDGEHCRGYPAEKPQNEFPVTDKADRENHGLGLADIKSTAEKHQGIMDYKGKGRVFILPVMMENERENGKWVLD